MRRLAVISLSGGVPAHFLDNPELKPFGFDSRHFESARIPLNYNLNLNLNRILELVHRQFQIFSLYSGTKHPNEASLRMHFWDPILSALFINEEYTDDNDIVAELHVKKILKINDERKIDYSIISTNLGIPVFCLEAGLELMKAPWVHKNFSKLIGLLASSCARQVEILEAMGHDPLAARSFGSLTGGTAIQLAVGHPVIIPQPDSDKDSFYVCVSCPKEWFFDMVSPSLIEENESINPEFETNTTEIIINPATVEIPDDVLNYTPTLKEFNVIKRENFISELLVEEAVINVENLKVAENPNSSIAQSRASRSSRGRRSRSQTPPRHRQRTEGDGSTSQNLNMNSVKKLANFMKCVKDYIAAHRSDGGDHQRGLIFQDEVKIASLSESHEDLTPNSKKILLKSNTKLGTVPPINFPPAHTSNPSDILISVEKSMTFEYDLYKNYLKNNPVFPVCFSAYLNTETKCVKYLFERMSPLLKHEKFFIQLLGEDIFGPKIRCNSIDELFMEAITFACHVLYGVYILHEEFGIVHSDISPSNIMFSEMFDCWKLNDFNQSMKFEGSVSCQRIAGTRNFVAPESKASGIFTKASDIYSIGSVLFMTFNIKMMELLERNGIIDYDDPLMTIYNRFLSLIQAMIQDKAEERPNAKTALTHFYNLLISVHLDDFEVYGSKLILIKIHNLIISESKEIEPDSIPMNPIKCK